MIRRLIALAAPTILATAATAAPGFSFRAIEFAPIEQRLPAAQDFIRRRAAPGTPLPVAIAAMRRAEAGCRRRADADGAIVCRSSRVASNSASDLPFGDITWTVRLYPAANGTIAQATVTRERLGS